MKDKVAAIWEEKAILISSRKPNVIVIVEQRLTVQEKVLAWTVIITPLKTDLLPFPYQLGSFPS